LTSAGRRGKGGAIVTEVPKHSGKPSFVDRGENFYPAAAVN